MSKQTRAPISFKSLSDEKNVILFDRHLDMLPTPHYSFCVIIIPFFKKRKYFLQIFVNTMRYNANL